MTDLFFKKPIKVGDLKSNGFKIEYINENWWINSPTSAAMLKYYEGGEVEPSDDFEIEGVCGTHCAEIVEDISQKLGVDYIDDEEYFYGSME